MRDESNHDGADKRGVARMRTILGARAVFHDGRSAIDCQIRNISATGALLSLSETLSLPPVFDLEIPMRQTKWRAVLRWRSQQAAGVQFLEEQKPATSSGAGLLALEMENAMLRKRVGELVSRLAELGHSEWQK
jgi:hypothetical protein